MFEKILVKFIVSHTSVDPDDEDRKASKKRKCFLYCTEEELDADKVLFDPINYMDRLKLKLTAKDKLKKTHEECKYFNLSNLIRTAMWIMFFELMP